MTIFGRPFFLDKHNGRVMGVCAGLADYTGIDVTWLRVGFVAGTVFGAGSLALIYLIIGLVADARPHSL